MSLRSKPARPAIIFDGDDTLWQTQSIFKSVFDEFYLLLEHEGFDPQEARRVFTEVNQHLQMRMHMSTERIGRAMSLTYARLLQRRNAENGRRARRRAALTAEINTLAGEIYTRLPEPMPGVQAVLATLAEDFDLYLYSGGKDSTQRDRVVRLGLAPFFDDRVVVVTKKDVEALQRLLADYRLTPQTTWIVGNSPRFEVNPGLQLGLHAIWLCTNFWQGDLEDIGARSTFVAFSLPEVVGIVPAVMPTGSRQAERQATAENLAGIVSAENVEFGADGMSGATWVVGTSPKQHINPALRQGLTPIWIPLAFTTDEIEPICGPVFVAFSAEGARQIIDRWSDPRTGPREVIWEAHEGETDLDGSLIEAREGGKNLGGSMVVE